MTEIHPAARKHGVGDDDIRHAVRFALYSGELDDEPVRVLHLGPDTAANLLEVVVIVRDCGPDLAIHAMPMRARYRIHLPKGGPR